MKQNTQYDLISAWIHTSYMYSISTLDTTLDNLGMDADFGPSCLVSTHGVYFVHIIKYLPSTYYEWYRKRVRR